MLRLHVEHDAAAFQARVLPYLLEQEALDCLPIGLIAGLVARSATTPATGLTTGAPGVAAAANTAAPAAAVAGPAPDEAPLLATVERDGHPVIVALRTPPFRLVLSHLADEAALPPLVEALAEAMPDLPGVLGPAPVSRQFAEAWARRTGRVYRLVRAERIYRLERVTPVTGVPGHCRQATAADRPLLRDWLIAFHREAIGEAPPEVLERVVARTLADRLEGPTGALYLWEDGQPVALAGCGGPTPNGLRIGPVYTPPAQRRRGYASALTAAVSQQILDGGRRSCYLFTDLANPTSNRIYQAIGYRPVGDADEIDFEPAPQV